MYECKIYTEDIGDIAGIISPFFDGFTLNYGRGYWKDASENSVTITIVTAHVGAVYRLAKEIRQANAQEIVLVTAIKVDKWLVGEAQNGAS
ncbi:hypothetical protein LCGC14_2424060 [marine sediment metagenome]|uniref:Uncharacterized protein n=1 Tax=marine sediment metagenome TaxID=412755 RepID=A0A0F9BNY7_9ZZZZ